MANKKMKYYSLKPLLTLSPDAYYYVIFGQRSNGKTYAVLEYALERALLHGEQIGMIRRYKEDFKGKRGQQMFDSLAANGVISKLSKGKWDSVYYYSQRWYFKKTNEEKPKESVISDRPFAYAFGLTDMEHDKSTSYPFIKTIFFDEFISRDGYLPDEFILFMNTISTIVRERNDVKIFMCGNTTNEYCPYFKEMGLTNVRKMDSGKIDIYTYGDSGLKVAVEYSEFPEKKKSSDTYFAFNNPKLKMITTGVWEIGIYPHLTREMKFAPKDIIYHYFIEFESDLLMCEIVRKEDMMFTFIHRKTTPIQEDDNNIVYSPITNSKTNYRRKLTKPMTSLDKNIAWFFVHEKVFYQSNEVGEIVRNYLMWCKTATIDS